MRYVYLFKAGEDHYKVGITADIISRYFSLKSSNPRQLEIVTVRLSSDARTLEQKIHGYLNQHKLDGGREWFKLTDKQAVEVAIMINKDPEPTPVQDVKVGELLETQAMRYRSIEAKVDRIVGMMEGLLRQVQTSLYSSELPGKATKLATTSEKETDAELIQEALAIIKANGRASTSLLQRKLSIGYGRAARIIDNLEQRGMIGAYGGTRGRDVFIVNADDSEQITSTI